MEKPVNMKKLTDYFSRIEAGNGLLPDTAMQTMCNQENWLKFFPLKPCSFTGRQELECWLGRLNKCEQKAYPYAYIFFSLYILLQSKCKANHSDELRKLADAF